MTKNSVKNKGSDKYDRILKAAVKVFAENGFHGSKVSQIAKEADVADGTIYLYFKNKDDILISLFEENMDWIINTLEEDLKKTEDPVEKIRVCIRNFYSMAKKNRDLASVITIELRQSTKFMKEYDNKQFARYLKTIARVIEECQKLNIARTDISPETIARAIFGMLDEMTLFTVFSPGGQRKQNMKQIFEEIVEFIVRGLTYKDPENMPPKPEQENTEE